MISLEVCRWLASPDGSAAMEAARALPEDRLVRIERLRRSLPADRAAAVAEMAVLQRRARAKFRMADSMLFTPAGLEQSTGDIVAAYRASRFPEGPRIADFCCGIGGDSLHLARRGPTAGVDIDRAALTFAMANAAAAGVGSFQALQADVQQLDLRALRSAGVERLMADPSRRSPAESGRAHRSRSGDAYHPPLRFCLAAARAFAGAAIKVSPAIPDEEIAGCGAQVEFVSSRGECKEAILWTGDLAIQAGRGPAAVLLSLESPPARLDGAALEAGTSEPLEWVLEPDPAVIRAGLVDRAAEELGALRLDAGSPYLTAGAPPAGPWAASFHAVEWLPFERKALRGRLRALHRYPEVLKVGQAPFDPEDLGPALRRGLDRGDQRSVVIVAPCRGQLAAIICDMPAPGGRRGP